MCFGGGKENKAFRQQQQQSFQNFQEPYDQTLDFANVMRGAFDTQFGLQSDTNRFLQGALGDVVNRGPGKLGPDWMYGGYGNDPTKNPPGPYQNKWGTGGGVDANGNPIAGGGGGGRGGAGGGAGGDGGGVPSDPFADMKTMSGYDPSIYQWQPRRFNAREESAMRGEASEGVTSAFGDAQQAFGQRALQLGQNAPGLLTAGISNLEAERASNEASAQRAVLMQGAQNLREDQRAGIPLRAAQGEALAREAQMQNSIAMQQAQARQQAAMQRAAIAASQRNARMAAGAQRYAANQANSRQRALDAEYARRFDAEMRLKGAQFQSENFWRGIGAMGGLGGDAANYAQLGMGGYNQAANIYQNPYNISSQGMTQTRGQGIGGFLGSLVGGAANAFTGGLMGTWGKAFGGAGNLF